MMSKSLYAVLVGPAGVDAVLDELIHQVTVRGVELAAVKPSADGVCGGLAVVLPEPHGDLGGVERPRPEG